MPKLSRWGRRIVWLVAPALAVACSASQDTLPCSSNGKPCVTTPGGPSSSGGTGPGGTSGNEAGAPVGGPLASITVTPATAMVVSGQLQQFTLVAKDGAGNTPFPYPTFTWSVNGGGAIGSTGLFNATTAGGPFIVKVTSGAISGSAMVTVTPAPPPTITMGETAILTVDDSGNADMLLAQQATLTDPATLKSLSFYVASADGTLILGVYDATGPGGGPGEKKAETAELTPIDGWNTAPVMTPVLLAAGTYWLAYAPSSNDLHFERAGDDTGNIASFANPYGPMPQTFSTNPSTTTDHWSFYATLNP